MEAVEEQTGRRLRSDISLLLLFRQENISSEPKYPNRQIKKGSTLISSFPHPLLRLLVLLKSFLKLQTGPLCTSRMQ